MIGSLALQHTTSAAGTSTLFFASRTGAIEEQYATVPPTRAAETKIQRCRREIASASAGIFMIRGAVIAVWATGLKIKFHLAGAG
jgi:hypothetical protein